MVLPTGAISMSQVNTEIGNPSTSTIDLNNSTVRGLAAVPSGAISMDNLRGKSAGIQATGGSISYSGSYKIHTFTGPGTFSVTANTLGQSVEYLVVAGGGGGAAFQMSNGGGGGGAGGMRTGSIPAPTGNYPVTIGAGGVGGRALPSQPQPGSDRAGSGSPSSALSITSTGGGAGGGGPTFPIDYRPGIPGGSGGGAASINSFANHPGGSGISGQGFPGGNSNPPTPTYVFSRATGAGGGGASEKGYELKWYPSGGVATTGSGKGGNGLPSSISGSNITYAGGGGGGSFYARIPQPSQPIPLYYADNSGGSGGGGQGAVGNMLNSMFGPSSTGVPPSQAPTYTQAPPSAWYRLSTAGVQNRGGGGGGGFNLTPVGGPTVYGGGSAGGSGIVILRYIQ